MGGLSVGKIAEATGLSKKSIRYYEAEGLIPKAERSAVGYRLYPPEVLTRLNFIQKAKAIGFSLDDIRGVLDLSKRGQPCCNQVVVWSDKRLSELDEQIKFLQQLRTKISEYQKKWKTKGSPKTVPESEICALIESIEI
jgi:MerR family copper efflux transcriptional regulator